ncbi:MAG TPA: hypothetical protein VFJ43_00065 [Bacteroidia bacterium]|nr:hypothetical protein [Bacteroidia bacterium]
MSENNKGVLTLRGFVRKKLLPPGSANEHDGFVLELYDEDVKLRRENVNPCNDNFFERYSGKSIEVNGYRICNDFFVLKVNGVEI